MIVKTVNMISDYFDDINEALGYNLEFDYEIENKGVFPLRKRKRTMIIIPDLFNHKDLSDKHRKMLMVYYYSKAVLDRRRDVVPISPEILAKGICDLLGEEYIPMYKVEEVVRNIRISIYDDIEQCSFFSVGDTVKTDFVTRYHILNIRKENGDILIDTEHECLSENPSLSNVTLEEGELYELYTHKEDHFGKLVDLRNNLFILSAPSGTGKNTVLDGIMQRLHKVKKAVTATTRKPRKNERNGVDYYFYSSEEFKQKSDAKEFAEVNFYDNNLYATPISETERCDTNTPLFLVVDFHGMREILSKYPLSTAIFLMPPSIESLYERIRNRGDNSEEEIERRILEARLEIKRSEMYDYIVTNDNLEDCVKIVFGIIKEQFPDV